MPTFHSRHTDQGWDLRGQDWTPLTRFPRPARGPRSLAVMALEHVAHGIGQLGSEHVSGLSVQSADRLRMLLSSRGELSLHAWKLLLRHLPDPTYHEDAPVSVRWRYCLVCPCPQSQLCVFTRPLSSPATDFIAHLHITTPSDNALFGTHELLALAALPNLGVLEIDSSTDPCQVSDRLVKGWSLSPDAFPALCVLRLWGCYDTLTSACLSFATRLPVLAVLDLSVGNYHTAGWRDASEPDAAALGWTCSVTSCRRGPQEDGDLVRMLHAALDTSDNGLDIGAGSQGRGGERDDILADMASAWAFELYSFLLAQGYSQVPNRTRLDQTTSPTVRPFATLSLGQDDRAARPGLVDVRLLYVRTPASIHSHAAKAEEMQRKTDATSSTRDTRKRAGNSQQPQLRAKKSRGANVRDMLASLSGG